MNKLVIFDLDGTLINSVGGIANSVNKTRIELGFPPLEESLITSFTGDGAKKLLERSFADVELPIPVEDARCMIDTLCGERVVEKKRYLCGRWEIDEYFKANSGLFTAEIELKSVDEKFEIPAWLGEEISDKPEYTNGALSRNPYSKWGKI